MPKSLLLALLLVGCNPTAGDLPAPCDPTTLAAKGVECRALVRAKCQRAADGTVDQTCPELLSCKQWGKQWLACSPDAGTEAGAP